MRPIATDMHDFASLIKDEKICVDKTMFTHRLVTDSNTKRFFVSRPRRFGKSLTISASKELFQSRRDLCTLIAGMSTNNTMSWVVSLKKKLIGAKWDAVFDGLQSLYAEIAYGSTECRIHENSYGCCLSFLFATGGFDFTMENTQSNGRADVVAKHSAEICIFELKVDEPVDTAFKQLREKRYGEPFKADARPVWLVGLSFDSKTRHLVGFAVEKS